MELLRAETISQFLPKEDHPNERGKPEPRDRAETSGTLEIEGFEGNLL